MRSQKTGYLEALWGERPNDLWAVGNEGFGGEAIYRWNGSEWTKVSGFGAPFRGWTMGGGLTSIWGTRAEDVWAAGGEFAPDPGTALVVHWDGVAWTRMTVPMAAKLRGIWAGSTDVWAVGSRGTILRFRR